MRRNASWKGTRGFTSVIENWFDPSGSPARGGFPPNNHSGRRCTQMNTSTARRAVERELAALLLSRH
jgi:hypothetical protein